MTSLLENVSLKQMNAVLAIIHAALAIGFLGYFQRINEQYPNDAIQGVELSIRNHHLELNLNQQNQVSGQWVSRLVQNVPIQTVQNLLVGFFLVTAAFHTIYYVKDDTLYADMIMAGNNYLRWVEYAISSTMMLYIIAYISGVKDDNIYKSIFAMNIAMIYTGQVVEEKMQRGESWYTPMAIGFLLLMAEFLIIVRDFQSRIADVKAFTDANPSVTNGRTIPDWIKYMVWVLFLFFSSFGFISLYGAYSGIRYESIEKLYLIFSLLAKATLAGFIAYGTSRRQTAQPTPTPTP
jgi:hypothetical protein